MKNYTMNLKIMLLQPNQQQGQQQNPLKMTTTTKTRLMIKTNAQAQSLGSTAFYGKTCLMNMYKSDQSSCSSYHNSCLKHQRFGENNLMQVAQHQITIKDDNAQLKIEQSGFQMLKIFPASFTIRDKRPMDEKGKVMIAKSNISLKEKLEKVYKSKTGVSDLQSLFYDNHLQHIQSYHLGDKKNSTNDPNHPFWYDLTFKNCNLPSIPQGISTTIASGIKEFSTSFKNMWEGAAIYKRVERKVIRVLLRLHLAPTREAIYVERVKKAMKAVAKKMLDINETQQSDDMVQPSKTLSRKQIKSKIQHERHQIKRHQKKTQSDESNKEKYHRRIHSCEKRIHKLESLMKNPDQRDESNIYPNDKERSMTPEIPKSAVQDAKTLGVGDIIEKWEKEADEAEETEGEKDDEVKRSKKRLISSNNNQRIQVQDVFEHWKV
ncbi:hypothetical protein BDA99DRAFT_296499 [Phascolomyces articulosus]|uniref:Uncharacterized protein n=1 Tax=Phascolomyces articulosus TaxID=60185 RepID=A0AAD5JXQ1_9FUNG|nr:hypothetical protein BDA99DRAFT_296499 [Phascolomyces articulosus]